MAVSITPQLVLAWLGGLLSGLAIMLWYRSHSGLSHAEFQALQQRLLSLTVCLEAAVAVLANESHGRALIEEAASRANAQMAHLEGLAAESEEIPQEAIEQELHLEVFQRWEHTVGPPSEVLEKFRERERERKRERERDHDLDLESERGEAEQHE